MLALFGDMSASGGYYIAVACESHHRAPDDDHGQHRCDHEQSYNVRQGAREATSVSRKQVTIKSDRTPYKDILSMMREVRPEERAILTSIVDELYERFVEVVDAGRPNLDTDAVRRLADGRIYSANQALAVGLVDQIGSIDDAYEKLESLCEVSSARVVEQRRRPTFSDVLFGARSNTPNLEQAAASLLGSVSAPRFLYYWTGAR